MDDELRGEVEVSDPERLVQEIWLVQCGQYWVYDFTINGSTVYRFFEEGGELKDISLKEGVEVVHFQLTQRHELLAAQFFNKEVALFVQSLGIGRASRAHIEVEIVKGNK